MKRAIAPTLLLCAAALLLAGCPSKPLHDSISPPPAYRSEQPAPSELPRLPDQLPASLPPRARLESVVTAAARPHTASAPGRGRP